MRSAQSARWTPATETTLGRPHSGVSPPAPAGLGPDHKASLEPDELKSMVKAIRNIEVALGKDIKKPSRSEKSNILAARKSIVAKTKIIKGDILSEKNLTIKRPGNGISPMRWDEIIGSTATKNYSEDELI